MADINADVVRGFGRSLIMPPSSALSRAISSEALRGLDGPASGVLGGTGSGVLFAMNMTSGAGPTYGWNSVGQHTSMYTHSFVSGGGPGGRHRVDIILTPGAVQNDGAIGWESANGYTNPSQGGSRFFRVYQRYYSSNGVLVKNGGGVWGSKSMILNASPDTERTFQIDQDVIDTTFAAALVCKNTLAWPDNTWEELEGASEKAILPHPSNNVGYAIQWEVKSSTTTSSGNGIHKIWINNDTYVSPTRQSAGTTNMDVSAWGGIIMHGSAENMSAASLLTIGIGGFEAASEFDPSWFANMGSWP